MFKFLLILTVFVGCVYHVDKDGKPTLEKPTPGDTSTPGGGVVLKPGEKYPKCINELCSPNWNPMPDKCWSGGITVVCAKPKPTPTEAPAPTPEPSPTPEPGIIAPAEVNQCEPFYVVRTYAKPTDDVVVWAEQKFHIGRMIFDAGGNYHKLHVTLNTAGARVLNFRVNGEWKESWKILVKEDVPGCLPK